MGLLDWHVPLATMCTNGPSIMIFFSFFFLFKMDNDSFSKDTFCPLAFFPIEGILSEMRTEDYCTARTVPAKILTPKKEKKKKNRN